MKKKTSLKLMIFLLTLCFLLPAFAADPVSVESISLDKYNAVVSVKKNVTVKATIEPKNATAKKLDWIFGKRDVSNQGPLKFLIGLFENGAFPIKTAEKT